MKVAVIKLDFTKLKTSALLKTLLIEQRELTKTGESTVRIIKYKKITYTPNTFSKELSIPCNKKQAVYHTNEQNI